MLVLIKADNYDLQNELVEVNITEISEDGKNLLAVL